jgi:hypothetical protein
MFGNPRFQVLFTGYLAPRIVDVNAHQVVPGSFL